MRVETPAGATFRLTYGATPGASRRSGSTGQAGPGAARAGARSPAPSPAGMVGHCGRPRRRGALTVRRPDGTPATLAAAGHRRRRRAALGRREGGRRGPPGPPRPRIGLTYHLPDPTPGAPPRRADAAPAATATSGSRRSPVAGSTSGSCSGARGARPRPRRRPVRRRRDRRRHPADRRRPGALARRTTDATPLAGAWPLGHRVTRRAGRGWLLVGDAAGLPRSVHRRGPAPGPGLGRAGGGGDLRRRSRPDRRLRRLRAGDAASVPRQGRGVVARPGVPRRGPRCSSTPRGASPPARRFVRRWVS